MTSIFKFVDWIGFAHFDVAVGATLAAQYPADLGVLDRERVAAASIPDSVGASFGSHELTYPLSMTLVTGRPFYASVHHTACPAEASRGFAQTSVIVGSPFPCFDLLGGIAAAVHEHIYNHTLPDGSPTNTLPDFLRDVLADCVKALPYSPESFISSTDTCPAPPPTLSASGLVPFATLAGPLIAALPPPAHPANRDDPTNRSPAAQRMYADVLARFPPPPPPLRLLPTGSAPAPAPVALTLWSKGVGAYANIDDKVPWSELPVQALVQALLVGERIVIHSTDPVVASSTAAAVAGLLPVPTAAFLQTLVSAQDPWLDDLSTPIGGGGLPAMLHPHAAILGTCDTLFAHTIAGHGDSHVIFLGGRRHHPRGFRTLTAPPPGPTDSGDRARAWGEIMAQQILSPLRCFFGADTGLTRGRVAPPPPRSPRQGLVSGIAAFFGSNHSNQPEQPRAGNITNLFLMSLPVFPLTPLTQASARPHVEAAGKCPPPLLPGLRASANIYSRFIVGPVFTALKDLRRYILEPLLLATWLTTVAAAPRPPPPLLASARAHSKADSGCPGSPELAARAVPCIGSADVLLVEAAGQVAALGEALLRARTAVRRAMDREVPASDFTTTTLDDDGLTVIDRSEASASAPASPRRPSALPIRVGTPIALESPIRSRGFSVHSLDSDVPSAPTPAPLSESPGVLAVPTTGAEAFTVLADAGSYDQIFAQAAQRLQEQLRVLRGACPDVLAESLLRLNQSWINVAKRAELI